MTALSQRLSFITLLIGSIAGGLAPAAAQNLPLPVAPVLPDPFTMPAPIAPITPTSPSSQPFLLPPSPMPTTVPALPASGIDPVPAEPSLHPEAYTLTMGDRIFIAVANVPEFSAQYQILVDGSITLPIIGSVSIWGMTLTEAAQVITEKYVRSRVLFNPTITVSLLASSPLKVALAGAVNRPGSYNLAMVDGKLPTLTEAIQQAGGITEQADLRQVKVVRARRSGHDDVIQVNLWNLLQSGDLRQDLVLHNGDSIFLATATTIEPKEASILGSANLAPEVVQVGIVGEVQQPGTLKVPPNTPLNQVLLAAGGFNNRARKRSVDLIRLNPDGTVSRREIAVDFSQNVNDKTNPILRHRDVIIVRRSGLAAVGDTLSTILNPVGQAFSLFNLFKVLFPQPTGP